MCMKQPWLLSLRLDWIAVVIGNLLKPSVSESVAMWLRAGGGKRVIVCFTTFPCTTLYRWSKMPSRELVPGDLIEMKAGEFVPADCVLVEGQQLDVDQSALTGESLPVTLLEGEKAKMGSVIKAGNARAVVTETGSLASPFQCT